MTAPPLKATPAILSRRHRLRPFSTRAVLLVAPVEIRHVGGRPQVDVTEFAAALRPGRNPVVSQPQCMKKAPAPVPPGAEALFASSRVVTSADVQSDRFSGAIDPWEV